MNKKQIDNQLMFDNFILYTKNPTKVSLELSERLREQLPNAQKQQKITNYLRSN